MATNQYTHDDLVTLTRWMANCGYDAETVAYAVEKPHKYESEMAVAIHERDNEGHSAQVYPDMSADCDDCNWTPGDDS